MSTTTAPTMTATPEVQNVQNSAWNTATEQPKTATTDNTSVPNGTSPAVSAPATEPPSDVSSSSGGDEDRPTSVASIVLSAPKTTEELIAERASKRAAKRQAIREKAEGHKSAGDYLFSVKNYKASYAQYLEAIQLWGSNPTYFISLAEAYRKLQWYEEAAHAATRALTLDPKNTEARYVRGVSRLEQRLLKPAKIDFETVLAQDPLHLLARAALTEVTAFINASTAQLGSHEVSPEVAAEVGIDSGFSGIDFSFPPLDYDGMEADELSDSSDCNHVGNGIQCRFYNHEGCARGANCAFSHAPDEKSVRDELGKNVCIYHLLSSCKFGAAKCIYSHSTAALPKRGWWNHPEQVAKVKAVLEAAEKRSREQRQKETERWREHVKAMRAAHKEGKSKTKEGRGAPKSAGLKKGDEEEGANVKGNEGQATASGSAGEPPKSAGAPPKSAGLRKKNGPPRRRPQAQKKPAKKADDDAAAAAPTSAASPTSAATTTTGAEAGANAKSAATNGDAANAVKDKDDTATAGFTDYKPNAPPNGAQVNPDTSVVLNY